MPCMMGDICSVSWTLKALALLLRGERADGMKKDRHFLVIAL